MDRTAEVAKARKDAKIIRNERKPSSNTTVKTLWNKYGKANSR